MSTLHLHPWPSRLIFNLANRKNNQTDTSICSFAQELNCFNFSLDLILTKIWQAMLVVIFGWNCWYFWPKECVMIMNYVFGDGHWNCITWNKFDKSMTKMQLSDKVRLQKVSKGVVLKLTITVIRHICFVWQCTLISYLKQV